MARHWTRQDRRERMGVAVFLLMAFSITVGWIGLLVMGAIWLFS